jgi:tetrapyrrole methylase family protein/MazG family protein
VFKNLELDGVQGVVQNWERLKAAERETRGKTGAGLLDGVASALPALAQAEAFQKRAARVGFDWLNMQGVLDKVLEEFEEIRQSSSSDERFNEVGDLLFAVVNFARWLDVDAESALRESNTRFRGRFEYMEVTAHTQDRSLSGLTLEEMDDLWDQSKQTS